MKRWCTILMMALLLCSFAVGVFADSVPLAVPGEIIVVYNDSTIDSKGLLMGQQTPLEEAMLRVHDNLGAKADRIFVQNSTRIEKVKVAPEKVADALRAYNETPGVLMAEPNFLLTVQAFANDSSFNAQYALDVVNAQRAWDTQTGNTSVIIAILDTGVDWNHPDLAQNIWNNTDEVIDGTDTDGNGYIDDVRGYDFVNSAFQCDASDDCDVEDNDPIDFQGHGTHCAGIAAARGFNGIGVAGVCPFCTIMPVRAGYKHTSGAGTLSVADVVQSINYAVDNGADVLSMSFSGGQSAAITAALTSAHSQGVVSVAAAGNDNSSTKAYPAAQDEVIGVASTDSSNARSSFSNYGTWVDVAAPGSSIYSTGFDDTYTTLSGTSMSTPLVAGVAGLILSANPNLSNEQVRSLIRSSVTAVSTAQFIGTGIVDAKMAVEYANSVVAQINASLDSATLTGRTAVPGNVSGSAVVSYNVSFGQGIYPSTQLLAVSASGPASPSLGVWDTSLLSNDTYTVTLNVQTSVTHNYSLSSVLEVSGSQTMSLTNGSSQSFVTPASTVDAIRLFAGVDDDVLRVMVFNASGAFVTASDWSTVFQTHQQMDYLLEQSLSASTNYRVVVESLDGSNISVLLNSSDPYATGNLSIADSSFNSSDTDLAFSLLVFNQSAPLVVKDMTVVQTQNSPPRFDTVVTSANESMIQINWSTTPATNGTIRYGTNISLASIVSVVNLSSQHAVSLTNLLENTTYFFNITMCNADNTCVTNGTNSVTTAPDTTAPEIFNLSVQAITNESIQVAWSTTESANAQVNATIGGVSIASTTNASFGSMRTITISGLIANTAHNISVRSCDIANNCQNASLSNISTLQTDAFPAITSLSPINNSIVTSSPVNFVCNGSDDVRISTYRLLTNESGSFTVAATNATNATSASFSISILEDNALIGWRCQAEDNASQVANGSLMLIQTNLPPRIIDTEPDDGDSYSSSTSSIDFEVETNEIAECRMSSSNVTFESMTIMNVTNTTDHEHPISGLSAGTSYTRWILCRDAYNNTMSTPTRVDFSVRSASSGGGGGGGGGGGSSASSASTSQAYIPPVVTSSSTQSTPSAAVVSDAPRDVPAVVSDTTRIRGAMIRSTSESPLTLEVATVSEADVPEPLSGAVEYLSLHIDAQVDAAEITFALDKSLFLQDSVTLFHYVGGWNALATTLIEVTDTEYVYRATTDGFSFYAIVASPKIATTPPESALESGTVEVKRKIPWVTFAFFAVGAALLAAGFMRYRRR